MNAIWLMLFKVAAKTWIYAIVEYKFIFLRLPAFGVYE
jgi:hypothetical protein